MSNLVVVNLVTLIASSVCVRQDVVDVGDIDMELNTKEAEHAARKTRCSNNEECSMLVGAVGRNEVCYDGASCSSCPVCAAQGDDDCPGCLLQLCDLPEREFPQCQGGYKIAHELRCTVCKVWGHLEEKFAFEEGLTLQDVDHGGDCMYHAIAVVQLMEDNPSKVRQDIARALKKAQLRSNDVMRTKKFSAQIQRDYQRAKHTPMQLPPTEVQFQEYLDYYILQDKSWGNEVSVLGASLAYGGTWHLVECYEFGNTLDSFGFGSPHYYIMSKNQHFFAAVRTALFFTGYGAPGGRRDGDETLTDQGEGDPNGQGEGNTSGDVDQGDPNKYTETEG